MTGWGEVYFLSKFQFPSPYGLRVKGCTEDISTNNQLINESVLKVFVEQPLVIQCFLINTVHCAEYCVPLLFHIVFMLRIQGMTFLMINSVI